MHNPSAQSAKANLGETINNLGSDVSFLVTALLKLQAKEAVRQNAPAR